MYYAQSCTFGFPKCEWPKTGAFIRLFQKVYQQGRCFSNKRNAKEPRNKFLLNFFLKEGLKTSNVNQYQFWRHDNHPIELWSNRVIWQKINYTHKNPVKAGLVTNAEEYRYSSAIDYADEKGLLEDIVVFRMFNI